MKKFFLIILTMVFGLFSPVSALFAQTVDDDLLTSQYVEVTIVASMTADDFSNIENKQLGDTVITKTLIWRGTSQWDDVNTGSRLFDLDVVIKGNFAAEGQLASIADSPGLITLKYAFFHPITGKKVGAAIGFITLEGVDEFSGGTAFKGKVTIGGLPRVFVGTGDSDMADFIFDPDPPPDQVLNQDMSNCVLMLKKGKTQPE